MSLMDDLIRAVGAEAAARLIDAYGGTRIYIPVNPQTRDRVSAVIGIEKARELAKQFGGDRIYIAHPPLRRRRIAALRIEGKRTAEIARLVGCTVRWVEQVLRDGPQGHSARPAGSPS